ncbi:MAG TPA: tyrosine-protein phosphatase [Acidimicrobiia bacterium]|nr:tyrosine-protein phosphatase [Acidimicrobiia bacterium]
MRLLRPGSVVGRIGDALVPADLYPLAYEPVALFGMAYPSRVDWAVLATHGVGHVVCLTHDAPPYDPAPLRCTAIRLADLYHGGVPLDVDAEQMRVRRAASVVVDSVRAGVGVAVHCHAGRGRTGAVLGAALVVLGHDPARVVEHLDRVQRERGKPGWPESPWQAEVVAAAATWGLSSPERA